VESVPRQFRVFNKDGNCGITWDREKGFYTIKSPDETIYDASLEAKKACPVKIIDVKQV
jgi:ferredoxin